MHVKEGNLGQRWRMLACESVRATVRVCTRMCVSVCVRARVRVSVCVRARVHGLHPKLFPASRQNHAADIDDGCYGASVASSVTCLCLWACS